MLLVTVWVISQPSVEIPAYFSPEEGGELPYAEVGDACCKVWIKPLKETNLGMAKRYRLKWNRLDYQLLLRKGATLVDQTQEIGKIWAL